MAGYKRDIVMRVVAVNGGEYVYWFADKLTDLGTHVRCTVTYPRTMTMREDINRIMRPVVYAKRAMVEIEVLITSMADHQFLQEIAEALDDPINYSVYLSLDGGVVEREVVWGSDSGIPPMPIRGKTVVGATFNLSLQTKEPIGVRGPMMTDPANGQEYLQNGNMDQWVGAGDIRSFTEVVTAGTATQENSIVHTAGGSSLKLDTTGAGNLYVYQNDIQLPRKHITYRASGWFRAASAGQGRVAIANNRTGLFITLDGKTWGSQVNVLDVTAATAFVYGEFYFRLSTSFLADDYFTWYALAYTNPSTMYHDDCSLMGPALRPGYATW